DGAASCAHEVCRAIVTVGYKVGLALGPADPITPHRTHEQFVDHGPGLRSEYKLVLGVPKSRADGPNRADRLRVHPAHPVRSAFMDRGRDVLSCSRTPCKETS